ncbi:MAG: phosphopantothenoylcysteine decarboxylase, partial [Kurthia sp.]
DILKTLGERKQNQLLIGFAAETNDVLHYAEGKLKKKNADYIVANDVSKTDRGFGADENTVTIVGKNDFLKSYPSENKEQLAKKILADIIKREGL